MTADMAFSIFIVLYEIMCCCVPQQQHEGDMPPYFKFITIMAFQVFIEMKVDVAVIEVGVGGQYDCTNVIK